MLTREIAITKIKVKEVELRVRYSKLKLMAINCKFNFEYHSKKITAYCVEIFQKWTLMQFSE